MSGLTKHVYPATYRLCLSLICAAAVIAQPQNSSPYLCKAQNIPLQVPENFCCAVRKHDFASSKFKQSSGMFSFENRMAKSVVGVAAAIEYQDSDGNVLLVMPYFVALNQIKDALISHIQPEYPYNLEHGAEPGEIIRVLGESPVVVGKCPVLARLSYITLFYSDLSISVWSSPGWRSYPVLKSVPTYRDWPTALAAPFSTLCSVRINEEGRIVLVRPLQRDRREGMDVIQEELSHWEFHPGVQDGSPVATELNFLIRFGVQGSSDPWVPSPSIDHGEITRPVIVVDFMPSQYRPGKRIIYYGHKPGDAIID